MTVIALPTLIPALPEMETDEAAMGVTDDFRGAATATSDVHTALSKLGSPSGWQGSDADSADNQMTVLARDADVASGALEKVALASDTYVTAMVALNTTRRTIDDDRISLNRDIEGLAGVIDRATEADVPALEAQASGLLSRADEINSRITAWQNEITAAEDRFIGVLKSVDTLAEATDVADDPQRVDVTALLGQLGTKKDPKDVTAWWDGLTPAQQEALKVHSPEVVGNTNGIPSGDRDDANRGSLQQDLAYLTNLEEKGELTPTQELMLKNARSAEKGLDLGSTTIDPSTGRPVDTNLLVYLPDAFNGDGAVAVSYGDPDTADNTAVIVPGLTNDGSKIDSQGADALRLFLTSSQSPDGSENRESSAVIAWMGYDAPSMTGDGKLSQVGDFAAVGGEGKAEAGGHLLSGFVDGLRATDDGEESHLTVIGHSYGSTTAAHAATDGLDADRLVLIGSPGAGGGSDHVSDLNMPAGTVYVGSAENDPVTWLGRDDNQESDLFKSIPFNPFDGEGGLGMGEDPSQSSFGAQRFTVSDGVPLHADTLNSDGFQGNHTAYLDQGSTSLGNITKIVQGEEPTIVSGREQDANSYLTDWGKDEARYQAGQAYDKYIQEPIVDPVVETYEDGKQVVTDTYETGKQVVTDTYETGKQVVTDPVGSFKKAFGLG